MATHRISIGAELLPADANVYQVPYLNINPATLQNFFCWTQSATSVSLLTGNFPVPLDYVSNPKIIVQWTSQTAAGNCLFQVRHRSMLPGTTKVDLITSPARITDQLTTSGKPGAPDDLEEDAIALTATDIDAGDLLHFGFYRAGNDVADTKADTSEILALLFEYDDA